MNIDGPIEPSSLLTTTVEKVRSGGGDRSSDVHLMSIVLAEEEGWPATPDTIFINPRKCSRRGKTAHTSNEKRLQQGRENYAKYVADTSSLTVIAFYENHATQHRYSRINAKKVKQQGKNSDERRCPDEDADSAPE